MNLLHMFQLLALTCPSSFHLDWQSFYPQWVFSSTGVIAPCPFSPRTNHVSPLHALWTNEETALCIPTCSLSIANRCFAFIFADHLLLDCNWGFSHSLILVYNNHHYVYAYVRALGMSSGPWRPHLPFPLTMPFYLYYTFKISSAHYPLGFFALRFEFYGLFWNIVFFSANTKLLFKDNGSFVSWLLL